MELASNLVWIVVTLVFLGMTYRGVRRGSVRLSMRSAMTLTLLVCFILLPVISMSDDLLEAHQAALPLSGQTWQMATEGVSAGLDTLVAIGFCLLFLTFLVLVSPSVDMDQWNFRPLAEQLARSQRLRPPPCAAY